MRKILLCFLLIPFAQGLLAQPTDKAAMEKERQQLEQELKEMQGAYNKVKGQTKQTLGQLNVLTSRINLQEKYIGNISKELKFIDDDIYTNNLKIYRLQKQLDTLKSEYARTLVYAYTHSSSYDYLNFIFSASSFNDAMRRIDYLKSYRDYREKQVAAIRETQDLIGKQQQQQQVRKVQKNTALQNQTVEVAKLAEQKKEKDVVVSNLRSQGKSLEQQINAKKKRDRELKTAVQAVVLRAIKEAKDKEAADAVARKKADDENRRKQDAIAKTTGNSPVVTTPPKTVTVVTPTPEVKKSAGDYLVLNAEDAKLAASFELNRGKLPWPVDNGNVCIPYGISEVEGLGKVKNNSPFVTICTPSPGGPVKAVFDGEVCAIHIYDEGSMIVIKHGRYFSSYSNLGSVKVSKGMMVKTGQVIGTTAGGDDGASGGGEIEFMLMKESNDINPMPWLRR